MSITTAPGSMTSEEIARLSRDHTFFSWSVQGAVDPIAIDRAEGVYLYTPEGKRILDFNSQLMSVNIGHRDRRALDAITAPALKPQYAPPAPTPAPRAAGRPSRVWSGWFATRTRTAGARQSHGSSPRACRASRT